MSAGVACPQCSSRDSRVVDSRPRDNPVPHLFRRRQCNGCEERFSTRELLDDVDFSGFVDCRKLLPTSRERIRQLVDNVSD